MDTKSHTQVVTPLKPIGCYMYRPQTHWLLYVSPTFILKPFAQRMHLHVLYGSQNKQELFPNTALTLFLMETVCLLRGTHWNFKYNSG